MHIAILTFEGFNELDSLITLGILCRIKKPGWRVSLACPSPSVTSMNGVSVAAQASLADACAADAVIVGSGMQTRDIVRTPAIMNALKLDPARQLITLRRSEKKTNTSPRRCEPFPPIYPDFFHHLK